MFHRARAACFIAPDAFSVLYTRRTREDAFSVPRLSIYTIHRSKVCVCSKFFQYTGHGRRASFTTPWVFTVLWRAGRERSRLPFRARSAIHRAVGFIRSAARRTREHAKRVSSRRMHSPFYTRAGRGRGILPFRGFQYTQYTVQKSAYTQSFFSILGTDAERLSSRTRSVSHRAGGLLRSAARRTREVTPPFRGRFGRHAQEYLCMIFQKRDFSFFKTEYSCKRSQFKSFLNKKIKVPNICCILKEDALY